MRKLILTVALAATTMFAGAQALTSKNGTPILPEADDWSIGFDANPMLNYFGNLFNNSTNNSVSMNYPSNNAMTLVGKMVVDENTAYRAKVAINFGSSTMNTGASSFTNHNDSISIASETKLSSMNITLGAGIQKWRGKGRLKGYYGAEAMIGFGGATDTTYTYPTALNPAIDGAGTSQVNEVNAGSVFGIGVNGFIGVEYFFAPKMSLSAEYTWGVAFSSTGASEVDYSIVENTTGTPVVANKTAEGGKSSSFNIGVGNTVTPNVNNNSYGSGSIVLSFYF
jgi:hypothetical protein